MRVGDKVNQKADAKDKSIKNVGDKNKFIYNFNFERFLLTSSQSNAISILLNSIKSNSKYVFYIIGNSNSGKTTTIMMLFDKCTESINDFIRINKRSIYISPYYNDNQINTSL